MVVLVHGGTVADRAFVRLVLERIRRLSGIKIIETSTGANWQYAEIELFFVPKTERDAIARTRFGMKFADDLSDSPCLNYIKFKWDLMIVGQTYVTPDADWKLKTACVVRTMMGMIGFPGNAGEDHLSVRNRYYRGIDFTEADRILIRGYYGGAYQETREPTLHKARTVFWKLQRDYKARGEAALVHPDYKPMPKAEMDKILATLRRHLTPEQQSQIKELNPEIGK